MSDILTIKRLLASRAQSVAEYLLPAGRKEGAEWRCGSVGGEPGKSLGVHLTGDKAGLYSDFATGQGGDLLDLWRAARGCGLSQALTEATDWLGIRQPESYHLVEKTYTRPEKPKCRKPVGRVMDYLTEDRNLPMSAIDAYKIGEAGSRIVFPFLTPDGQLVMVKEREAVDGAKSKPTTADCEPILFGWQAIPDDAREVTITEGEIDAPSMYAFGWPALSPPFGGGGGRKQTNWIERDYERLQRFEKIYLATDMDAPGDAAAAEISQRLGRHRCYRVRLPLKDANDCLVAGISTEEIRRCMDDAQSLDPEGLSRPSAYQEAVTRLFWPQEGDHVGYSMPYAALRNKLLFRPSEMTLWSGATGSGKSQIISDCIPGWIKQGSVVCVASLEMRPQWTLKRLVKQTLGVDRPSEPAIQAALKWLDGGLLLYERIGKAGVDALLEIFDYARAKYGCDQFVIDSLMRVGGIASDDYAAQEKAVFQMVTWANDNAIHLHLVAHARKGGVDAGPPQIDDIKGASEIVSNAHNALTIFRNRRLEDERREASDEEAAALADKPGVIFSVVKQRNGDYEGRVGLWFNQENYQYFSSDDDSRFPRSYATSRDDE